MSGVAAAAALVASRKQMQPYKFEMNASQRKRHHTRLIRLDRISNNVFAKKIPKKL